MTTTAPTFNLEALRKDGAAALARQLGLRRDWARVKLPEILTMLRLYSASQLIDAAKACADFFDEEDIENLTSADYEADDSGANDSDATSNNDDTTPAPAVASATTPATTPAPSKPQVDQVAALLAQLLSTGAVNADQVGAIVDTKTAWVRNELTAVREQAADAVSAAHEATKTAIQEALANMPAREIVIKRADHADVSIDGIQHFMFETLLRSCSARDNSGTRLNVWLYGPPGTGKTTAARNVSVALGLDFYCTGALMSKYDLTGFIDANGKTVRSTFREAWEHGGVFLFDEIDGSAPQAVVAFNAALTNGVMAFPDGMVTRHTDCVVIAAANTGGGGATADFVGRMKLDAASLDRFVMLEWPIDEAIEKAMCRHPHWAETVQRFRRRLNEKGFKGIMVTPRATMFGSSLLDAGMQVEQVKVAVLRKTMSPEQWAALNA